MRTLVIAVLLLVGTLISAQQLRGRVRLADSAAAAAGVVLEAELSAGAGV